MKRINKIIELLEQDQPVYYVSTSDFSFENGVSMAQTWADYIRLDLEHGPFDISGVDSFMKGLVEGGPCKSGHRTPAVVAELPFQVTSRLVAESNLWIANHLLACGVHGLLLCHVESPEGVKALIEGIRYPIQAVDQKSGLEIGKRGHGGEKSAAKIWDLEPNEYMHKADPWPLNPDGELVIGVKMENKRAAERCEETVRVPGLCFGEWGLGDMSLSFGYAERPEFPLPEELEAVRSKIWNACRDAGLFFLGIVTPDNVTDLIDKGMRLCRAYDLKAVEIGKAHTGRESRN